MASASCVVESPEYITNGVVTFHFTSSSHSTTATYNVGTTKTYAEVSNVQLEWETTYSVYASCTATNGNAVTSSSTTLTTPAQLQGGAYLGCLEVPSIALASTTALVKEGDSYYGRQYEFETNNTSQTVVVLQYDDYNSTSGTSKGSWHRNYTMLYDNTKYSPLWVAYSLSDWHFPMSDSMSRPSWKANPSESLEQYSGSYEHSSNDKADSRGLAYDRGHMLANRFRSSCSYNSQRQTFFHTNQIPQVNSFNQGKWSALEGKEDTWRSECDTMYVVTGPIFDKGYYTTPDSNNNQIPVATRCFKAMIKCKWANGKLNEVKGIGFIMDNVANANSQSYTEAVTSIEEVEKACGFTLFVNLPSEFNAAKRNSTPGNFTSSW